MIKFSIIMPAYNEEKRIAKAIESVLNQSFKDFELVIVNDGSTDKTAEIVLNFHDKRIVFIDKGKVGKNAAYNIASKEISGDWVYFMGADDTMPLDALEKWNKYCANFNPNDLVAFSAKMNVVSDNDKYNGLILPKNKKRMNFSGPNTLMSKAMQKFILPLPEQYPNEDGWWGLCIDYFCKYKRFVDEVIINYTVHDGNSVSRKAKFDVFSAKYHSRFIVRETFLEKYGNLLDKKSFNKISNELKCENLRIEGKSFRILFVKDVSFIMRLRLFFFSKEWLYNIKIKNDRFFLGH